MLLHELGRDLWRVLAIAGSETECELQEVLAQPDANHLGVRMLRFLKVRIPVSGPSHNEEISKQLDGGIYEFRMTPNRGPSEIDKARKLRSEYLLAKSRNLRRIISAD